MTQILYAQDASGTRHKVIQRLEPAGEDGTDDRAGHIVYTLDDGSPVRRVDSDTFQVVATGAYITSVAAD